MASQHARSAERTRGTYVARSRAVIRRPDISSLVVLASGACAASAGCDGSDEPDAPTTSSSSTGGSANDGGSGGEAGAGGGSSSSSRECSPGSTAACYEGPPATEGVGPCAEGTKT